MKRIGKIFSTIKLVAHKERRGVIKDSQIVTAVETACAELYEDLLSEYITSRVMPDPLRAFKAESTIAFTSGISDAIVTDLYQLTGFVAGGRKAEEVYTDEEWTDLETSDIIAPTTRYPVVKLDGDPIDGFKIKVLPVSITSATARYLTMPTSWFTYASTSGTRENVYDDTNSVDILFGETEIKKIIVKALPYLGIAVQNQTLLELSQLKDDKRRQQSYYPYPTKAQ